MRHALTLQKRMSTWPIGSLVHLFSLGMMCRSQREGVYCTMPRSWTMASGLQRGAPSCCGLSKLTENR